ncbi:MAG TPA: EamA family transporter [Bryobacteraceae bacterium]|nr:EamA family transporter [Bryobacteraceae bacterium]
MVAGVVLTTCGADVLQAREMQRHDEAGIGDAALGFVRRPLLIASIACMAGSFFLLLELLRTADLTFAVPATALSFVFETALARWYLGELVDKRRWAASLLVALGVALLAL